MISANSKSFFKIWEVDVKDRYAEANMSTSRKDKKTGDYINSNWRYVRFVSDAFEKVKKLNKGDRITNLTLGIYREAYMKDGEKVLPKNPSFVVFDFDVAYGEKKKEYEPDNEPDELPF